MQNLIFYVQLVRRRFLAFLRPHVKLHPEILFAVRGQLGGEHVRVPRRRDRLELDVGQPARQRREARLLGNGLLRGKGRRRLKRQL